MPTLKWLATRFGLLLTFLTSFSRMYFGVHYPHDIVSGWICAIFLFVVFKYFFLKPPPPINVSDKYADDSTVERGPPISALLDLEKVGFLLVLFGVMMAVACFGGIAIRGHIGFFYCPGIERHTSVYVINTYFVHRGGTTDVIVIPDKSVPCTMVQQEGERGGCQASNVIASDDCYAGGSSLEAVATIYCGSAGWGHGHAERRMDHSERCQYLCGRVPILRLACVGSSPLLLFIKA